MWQCDKTHETHWATVDMGEATEINNIVISMDGGAYARDMKITVSEDGASFEEVYNVTDWSSVAEPREPGEPTWTKVVTDAKFDTTEAQYIKVDFNGDSFVYGITIYELEAYCRN